MASLGILIKNSSTGFESGRSALRNATSALRSTAGKFSAGTAAALFAVLVTSGAVAAAPNVTMVATTSGPVFGTTTQQGVQAWLGIPFAAPPIDKLRWSAPEPPAKWTTAYAATRFAPSCMQPLRNHRIAYYFGDDPTSEDCLYLNVWAPNGASADAKLPVIVYIHGGGFNAGSGRKPLYVGDKLAARGAVVVSINYRLGQLGFLAHPELSAESPTGGSGNYGFMDQVMALKWVKANIANFGGDPSRITIMGQSAGSMSLAVLQASPAARGLFNRIAAFSGSIYFGNRSFRASSLQAAERNGLAYQQMFGAKNLDEMRQIPADQFITKPGTMTPLVIDGNFLVEDPADTYRAGKVADVPMIVGVVRDEGISRFSGVSTLASYRTAVEEVYGNRAAAVLELYPARDDHSARAVAERLSNDLSFGNMMLSWADLQKAYGKAPVFAYLFDHKHPYTPGVKFSDLDPLNTGVNHTDEVCFWLGTCDSFNILRPTRNWSQADRALETSMQNYLIAFANGGNPNSSAPQRWPEYTSNQRSILRLSIPERRDVWPNADRIKKLAEIPPR